MEDLAACLLKNIHLRVDLYSQTFVVQESTVYGSDELGSLVFHFKSIKHYKGGKELWFLKSLREEIKT